jgi:hypothetical protein
VTGDYKLDKPIEIALLDGKPVTLVVSKARSGADFYRFAGAQFDVVQAVRPRDEPGYLARLKPPRGWTSGVWDVASGF